MAELKLEYSQGENQYSDGDIESELLNIVKNTHDYDSVLKTDDRWPIFYHLSHLRENILNWYPFKKDAEVLEVGAGCGAITGILCEKSKHVTAVELTRRRAEINFQRNKERDNLDIYVGDIFKVKFDKKFDYITVIGVLEYAAFMSDNEDPYSAFLQKIKSFLKPGGHILLAIENRFGLKYFAGAREDHTTGYFDGVNGYKNTNSIKTFTKTEMINLLDKNSLSSHRFYYPLPDYKFASSIYTDESINNFVGWIDTNSLDNPRCRLFDEVKVMNDFAKEKILDEFANSFFIDIAQKDVECDKDIITAKISSARDKKYRIVTLIKCENGKYSAVKVPLSEESKIHLAAMYEFYNKNKTYHGLKLIPCRINEDGSVSFDFATGKSFSDLIEETFSEKGVNGTFPLIDKYRNFVFKNAEYNAYYHDEKFSEYFGEERINGKMLCVSPVNIDEDFDNIFISADGSTVIDYEWTVDFPVPAEYLFWRTIFFSDVFKDHDEEKSEVYRHYNISDSMQTAFLKWEVYFTNTKVGCTPIKRIASAEVDLNDLKNHASYTLPTSVFFDTGNGFSPENSIADNVCKIDKESQITVTIPKDVKMIRFDPIENISVQCKITSAVCGKKEVEIKPLNAAACHDNTDFFLTHDPVYILTGNFEEGDELTIRFIVSELDNSLADMALSKRIADLNNKLTALNNEVGKLSQISAAYKSVLNSKSWKITAPLRKIVCALKK